MSVPLFAAHPNSQGAESVCKKADLDENTLNCLQIS